MAYQLSAKPRSKIIDKVTTFALKKLMGEIKPAEPSFLNTQTTIHHPLTPALPFQAEDNPIKDLKLHEGLSVQKSSSEELLVISLKPHKLAEGLKLLAHSKNARAIGQFALSLPINNSPFWKGVSSAMDAQTCQTSIALLRQMITCYYFHTKTPGTPFTSRSVAALLHLYVLAFELLKRSGLKGINFQKYCAHNFLENFRSHPFFQVLDQDVEEALCALHHYSRQEELKEKKALHFFDHRMKFWRGDYKNHPEVSFYYELIKNHPKLDEELQKELPLSFNQKYLTHFYKENFSDSHKKIACLCLADPTFDHKRDYLSRTGLHFLANFVELSNDLTVMLSQPYGDKTHCLSFDAYQKRTSLRRTFSMDVFLKMKYGAFAIDLEKTREKSLRSFLKHYFGPLLTQFPIETIHPRVKKLFLIPDSSLLRDGVKEYIVDEDKEVLPFNDPEHYKAFSDEQRLLYQKMTSLASNEEVSLSGFLHFLRTHYSHFKDKDLQFFLWTQLFKTRVLNRLGEKVLKTPTHYFAINPNFADIFRKTLGNVIAYFSDDTPRGLRMDHRTSLFFIRVATQMGRFLFKVNGLEEHKSRYVQFLIDLCKKMDRWSSKCTKKCDPALFHVHQLDLLLVLARANGSDGIDAKYLSRILAKWISVQSSLGDQEALQLKEVENRCYDLFLQAKTHGWEINCKTLVTLLKNTFFPNGAPNLSSAPATISFNDKIEVTSNLIVYPLSGAIFYNKKHLSSVQLPKQWCYSYDYKNLFGDRKFITSYNEQERAYYFKAPEAGGSFRILHPQSSRNPFEEGAVQLKGSDGAWYSYIRPKVTRKNLYLVDKRLVVLFPESFTHHCFHWVPVDAKKATWQLAITNKTHPKIDPHCVAYLKKKPPF